MFGHATTPKLMICSQTLPVIVCPKCAHQTIWSWVFARLPHHNKPRPDLSRVLKWWVIWVSPNCVRLLMVTYSIGGHPQTPPDQSQLHRYQSPRWAVSELPQTVVERGREATKCIHRTSAASSENTYNDPKELLSSSQYPQQAAARSRHMQGKQLCRGYLRR